LPDLTDRLAGRKVEAILKSDNILVIRCEDGIETHVSWCDKDGAPVNGEPQVSWYGKHVYANTDHIGLFAQAAGG
jgi:hypothetical protein